MRAVLQRVTKCAVSVDRQTVGAIESGLLVLLGIGRNDTERHADDLAQKILHLRVFEDADGKMNRSLLDTGGEMLIVSQFTLLADCRKGRRPSYADAAAPATAELLYRRFIEQVRLAGVNVATGRFGARMSVELENDGPVTLIVEIN